jgi:hypothetical protein
MAAALAAFTLAGFARTYFLPGFFAGPKPPISPIVHVHGALATSWILLLIAQTRLIAYNRRDIHRKLGFAGIAVGIAIVVLGLYVAIHSERRVHTPLTAGTLADPYVFLVMPFFSVGLFALFVTLGVLNRSKPESHKRYMMLGTFSMVVPAMARLVTQTTHGAVNGVVGAAFIVFGFLIALAIYDLYTRKRLHPVTLWGGLFTVISEPLRFAIGYSEPFQAFAKMLMT